MRHHNARGEGTLDHRPGALIIFSGLDGAGKSTQISLLRDRLRAQGQRVEVIWTRGGYTPRLDRLRALGRRLAGRRLPPPGDTERRSIALERAWVRRTWLTIAVLDLLLALGVGLRLRRCGRTIVLCDRYLQDSLIDFQLGFPTEAIEQWWLWRLLARVCPRPEASFLLLLPVAESIRRSDLKGEPFRDSPEMLARRLAEYEALARREAWTVLDGRQPAGDTAAVVAAAVDVLFENPDAYPIAARA